MTVNEPVLLVLSLATALVGTIGGIGGAALFVPVLVLSGVSPLVAAPLGLLAVAAGAIAAGPAHAGAGLVHHRLGVALEIGASSGTVVGALAAGALSDSILSGVLGVAALAAAVGGASRSGVRNLPDVTFSEEAPGEWPGTLAGQYRGVDGMVPYQAHNVPGGVALATLAGVVSGLSGVGGGFIKVPAMSELMRVPVKVASATSTFTIGITAAAGLAVHAGSGRIVAADVGPVVIGGILGGIAGSRLQRRLPPVAVRRFSAALLAAIGILVLAKAVA